MYKVNHSQVNEQDLVQKQIYGKGISMRKRWLENEYEKKNVSEKFTPQFVDYKKILTVDEIICYGILDKMLFINSKFFN